MTTNNLKVLKQVEKNLEEELHNNPSFRKLESIKSVLSQWGEEIPQTNEKEVLKDRRRRDISVPPSFSNNLTWNEKVMYSLSKLKEGHIHDMVEHIKKAGAKESLEFISKRVIMTVFNLKKKGIISSSSHDGERLRYSLI